MIGPLHPDFDFTPEQLILAACVDCDYCGAQCGNPCMSGGEVLSMLVGGVHVSRIRKGATLLR